MSCLEVFSGGTLNFIKDSTFLEQLSNYNISI
jgi:hypothetical protein